MLFNVNSPWHYVISPQFKCVVRPQLHVGLSGRFCKRQKLTLARKRRWWLHAANLPKVILYPTEPPTFELSTTPTPPTSPSTTSPTQPPSCCHHQPCHWCQPLLWLHWMAMCTQWPSHILQPPNHTTYTHAHILPSTVSNQHHKPAQQPSYKQPVLSPPAPPPLPKASHQCACQTTISSNFAHHTSNPLLSHTGNKLLMFQPCSTKWNHCLLKVHTLTSMWHDLLCSQT